MKWRTIFTDSESETGIAPECPDGGAHPGDHEHVDAPHHVYDCCPHPHIECHGEAAAEALAVFLTAMDAELCS